jgi:hypothetical protein
MVDDIDAMVETLSAALSEMMTDDGPLPGSVLDAALGSDDPLEQAATLLVFTSKLLGVSVAVADMVVGRFTDAVESVSDAVIDVDELERPD